MFSSPYGLKICNFYIVPWLPVDHVCDAAGICLPSWEHSMPPPPLPGSYISGDRGSQVLESSARVDSPPVKNPGDKGKMCPLGYFLHLLSTVPWIPYDNFLATSLLDKLGSAITKLQSPARIRSCSPTPPCCPSNPLSGHVTAGWRAGSQQALRPRPLGFHGTQFFQGMGRGGGRGNR